MKKLFFIIFILSCSKIENPNILVSIYPLKLVLNEIGISSYALIDKVVDIHSFEPSIRTILNVQNTCGFIYISDNLETWANNITSKYKLELLENNTNLHAWTDPKFILNKMSDIESLLLKCKINYSKDSINKLISKLKKIDSTNANIASKIRVEYILFHTSFEPFLKSYNLKIRTILLKEGHADILPSDLEKALSSKDKVIIKENYYSDELLRIFKEKSFRIISLDPYGFSFKTYSDFIKYISDSILGNTYTLEEN
ncbi:MAG: metal ABC transporter substrate-binding protein [candidate division WOR-3 bacterium]|nr:metal ABC transporter substrate-binding protein [candidate division WOR-3 bacterium]MCX7948287.1 metal ABC transporter substrate-binding protein [candidate division WOR-3 bacterium]MDW8150966.1 zinc ABC transporter substrate-binding protein [candidate division WOR-3 bacterium]